MREFAVAIVLAALLFGLGLGRVYLFTSSVGGSLAIATSLAVIVFLSVGTVV